MHVSAGNPFRRWPRDRSPTLAAALAPRRPARRIIITSGPSEARRGRRAAIAAARAGLATTLARRIVSLRRVRSLAELRALVDRAALYIGGDSGPLHVAATTTVPIVALFGPTLPERSAPVAQPSLRHRSVDAGPLPCRRAISAACRATSAA